MQETSTPKRAQENPQTYRVGAVAGRGVLSTYQKENILGLDSQQGTRALSGQTHVASNYLKLFSTNNKYSLLYINNFK